MNTITNIEWVLLSTFGTTALISIAAGALIFIAYSCGLLKFFDVSKLSFKTCHCHYDEDGNKDIWCSQCVPSHLKGKVAQFKENIIDEESINSRTDDGSWEGR